MIHLFRNNGYNLVLDVPSGAIHEVDDVVFDVLTNVSDAIEELADGALVLKGADAQKKIRDDVLSDLALRRQYASADLKEALSDIFTLIAEETLFTEDPYEPFIDAFGHRQPVVKALCLNVTHDCNLRCRYCFADEGAYHGERSMMRAEVGKAALDFLCAQSGSRKNLEVDFFGGEPLMNFPVVKEIVSYGRALEKKTDKRFRFTLTTNGVLLTDEILDYCNREMSNLVLSIDGRKRVHDKMRPFANGAGSYARIVDRFQKAAVSRNQQNYFVRGTFTRHNLDFAQDVLHLADLGFERISVEPVVAKPTDDYALRMEDVPKICAQYDLLASEMVRRLREGKGFQFFHFQIDLSGGPCVYKRLSGCGTGCEYLGVTPDGTLYPCHQFVGNDSFVMGDVFTGIKRTDLKDQFQACNVYTKKECRTCFARMYCAGGCAANAYNFTGSIDGTYEVGCALQKKRVECAIMLQAALSRTEEESERKEEAQ